MKRKLSIRLFFRIVLLMTCTIDSALHALESHPRSMVFSSILAQTFSLPSSSNLREPETKTSQSDSDDWLPEPEESKNAFLYSFDRLPEEKQTPEGASLTKLKEIQKRVLEAVSAVNLSPQVMTLEDSNLSGNDEIAQNNENIQTEDSEDVAIKNPPKTILINFNNVSIIEYIRFISRVTNKNFIFDENDLQFNVTIISEEPTTIENTMTALLQELRIHDLILIEEGNNFIIHRNPKVNSISTVITGDETPPTNIRDAEIVTKVFRLNALDPEKAAIILRPLTSESAIIEILKDSNHLIITDLSANITKISQLLSSIDAPNSGLVIGQYVITLSTAESLIPLTQQIMQPIAQDQTLILVAQPGTNSIFVVGSPYLVERAIAVIQYLDQQQGSTRILELQNIKIERKQSPITPGNTQPTPSGQWILGPDGNWIFKPEVPFGTVIPPEGNWMLDNKSNWYFLPGKSTPGRARPKGKWALDANGNWNFGLETGEYISPERLVRQYPGGPQIQGGVVKKSKLYIHKLMYRKGDSIERSLRQMADTLRSNEKANEDLIASINTLQWLDSSNSLVFSGTVDSLDKIRELIQEVDKPRRQVLLEMLILETTIDDALNYSVNYGTRFAGGNTSGSQGFISGASPLVSALATTGVTGIGQPQVVTAAGIIPPVPIVPNGTQFSTTNGFNLGIIGQKIIRCGLEFSSLGALVTAIHDRAKDNIIMNPKILTEDNTPAEVFVGINTPFLTQSISNAAGQTLTSNVQFRDVGTRLKVTPYIGNGDIITLAIEEEVTSVGITPTIQSNATSNSVIGQTTTKNHTTTRVHLPDGFFLIISGLMQDEIARERDQTPCLGAVPLLGALFSAKINSDAKRNTMIFIRPKIIDTDDEIQHFTKHNQDMWDYRRYQQNSLEYEVKEALDFFNVRRTLYPSDCGNCNDCDN